MTRRMRHVITTPRPAAPSWQPATVSTPGWEIAARERWQGAAQALAVGRVPRYSGDCRWRQRRNQMLREQYGTEVLA